MDNFSLPDRIGSLWSGTTPPTDFPELSAEMEFDVAVIGGGIAGLNAAYFLKRAGLKVAVLEATYVAAGTSGNTTAKVTSQHELKYDFLIEHFGELKARLYAEANQWAIDESERIIIKEKINCDFNRFDAYAFSRTVEGKEEIKKEVAAALKLGLPASFIIPGGLFPFPATGAIRFTEQAYFHPRKYLLAIADLVNSGGSCVFEKTKALDLREGKDFCEVITEKNHLKAGYVVVATNQPFYDAGNVFGGLGQTRSYVLAAGLGSYVPRGMFIGVDGQDVSFRPHISAPDKKWLIIAGVHRSAGETGDSDNQYRNLAKIARESFGAGAVEYKWAAQDSTSSDRVPYIGFIPGASRILVATGFSAWGMTTSFVSARLLTDLIIGQDNAWKNLYDPERLKNAADNPTGNPVKTGDEDLAGLEAGEGKVIIRNGEKLAVYKDKSGKIKLLSAVCTHMGCVVDWNKKEKTWDCPCHGSRYDKDGKVIRGPAIKALSVR